MKRVLLVSAYTPFLSRNTALLMGGGLDVSTAKGGGEAIKLHRQHKFDLILADFKLEDMGGCTLCSIIRKSKDSPEVPIIIACHNLPGSMESVERCGASSIAIKPIEPISLMENIGSLLEFQLSRSKRVNLKVFVFSSTYEQEFLCFSHDLSNTGILIETDHDLALGSRITCQFNLPDICNIVVEGEITRLLSGMACENIYGVKFIDLSLSARKDIDKYILSVIAQ